MASRAEVMEMWSVQPLKYSTAPLLLIEDPATAVLWQEGQTV